MSKQPYTFFGRKTLKTIAIIACSMTAAFILGIETAGDVQPIVEPTRADGAIVEGDFDGNGTVNLQDVAIALEIARGNRTPTAYELKADPNQDFQITFDDISIMLERIEYAERQ